MIIARLAATSTAFTPGDLSPKLWLDASDTSTITEAGGAVSQWDNLGSLGNFTQPTAAYQPTTGASTLNSLNVLDFAGDFMNGALSSEYEFFYNGDNFIFAAVVQPGTTANPGAQYGICGNSTGSTSSYGGTIFYNDSTANDALGHVVYRGVGGTLALNNVATGIFTANTFSVISLLADPDNGTAADRSKTYVNAGTANANNTYTDAPNTGAGPRAFQVGAYGSSVLPFTGKIAEMIIVDGARATETNRQLLRNYLNEKWGVY
jgi:hypothetical protein